MEDDLQWKTTFHGSIIYYLMIILKSLTLTATAQLTPNRKSYQLSKAEIELDTMEEMYTA